MRPNALAALAEHDGTLDFWDYAGEDLGSGTFQFEEVYDAARGVWRPLR